MKATLIVEGKEFPIEINDPELEKLIKPKKKTGYERMVGNKFWAVSDTDCVYDDYDFGICNDECEHCAACDPNATEDVCVNIATVDHMYDAANYYSDKTVAENNARADKLMRQLRRFAVEHRKGQLYWAREYCNEKWSIVYDCKNKRLISEKHWDIREAFVIYFDSEETANLAIETFHDELIWYFTEYKDSL